MTDNFNRCRKKMNMTTSKKKYELNRERYFLSKVKCRKGKVGGE